MKIIEVKKLKKELDMLKEELEGLNLKKEEKLFISYYIDSLKDELSNPDKKIENWIKKEIEKLRLHFKKVKGDIE